MKLIWHIIKKDVVRDRLALLVWSLLFVLQVAAGLVARSGIVLDRQDHFMLLQNASGSLVLLQMLMGYILVARWVQADPLVGTAAFWPTRPVSAGRLLLAKALATLLVFVLLPVVVLLPWWLYCAFEAKAIFWAVVETVSWQIVMLAPAFLVAALTDDLGRVLLWTLLLVVGMFSWMVLLQTVVGRTVYGSAQNADGIAFTRGVAVIVMLVVVAAGVSVHQFLFRRLARSIGLVVLGLGLVVLAGKFWAWDWTAEIKGLTRKPGKAPEGLVERMEFSIEEARAYLGGNRDREREVHVNVPIRVEGLPEGVVVAAENVDHVWRWPSGLVFNRDNSFAGAPRMGTEVLRAKFALAAPKQDPETVQWHRAKAEELEAGRIARGLPPRPKPRNRPGSHLSGIVMHAHAPLPRSIVARMRTESPAYEVSFRGVLIRPEILLQMPLQLGTVGTGGSNTISILELVEDADQAKIVTTAPTVLRHGLWFSASSRRGRGFLREDIMTVNHEDGTVGRVSDNRPNRGVLIAGVQIGWEDVRLSPATVIRNGKSVLRDEKWLEHTSLVLLAEREAGRFEKTLGKEKFEVEPEPDATAN